MTDVILKTNGKKYGGWTSIRITRSMEHVAGSFTLSLTEKWAGQATPWPLKKGDECTICIGTRTAITGYIDEIQPEYDKEAHTLIITGRDKTGDLVDCSAIHGTGQWKNRSLLQIAADLCKPFGIPVSSKTDVGASFKRFTIQTGETVFETLESAARQRGVLLVPDGIGGLVITRASKEKLTTALVEGGNILKAKATLSDKNRYSFYRVIGENAGLDYSTPEQNAQPGAQVNDTEIKRYRPLIVLSEQQGDSARLKDRAQWEANVRAGRGSHATITVQGWAHQDGTWTPNTLVPVQSPFLKLQRDMLVTSVTLIMDDTGKTAELSLCRPEAFDLLPLPEEESLWLSPN